MTVRQFYIMFVIYLVSIKIQKLPALVSAELGKDSYILFLIYMLINLVGIILMYIFLKVIKKREDQNKMNVFLLLLKKVVMLATSFYFVIRSLLLYAHIQDLFANTLFDNLSWALFSLLLLFTVVYLANIGLGNIALNFEIYLPVIVVSYVVITLLGGAHTDFSYILPFENINFGGAFSNILKYNIWFGDFFVFYYIGRYTEKIKLSWSLILYSITMLFVALLVVEFNGIYKAYAPVQAGLISVLSEHSMLGINIGRVDWFLILLTEIGAILGCGVSLYFATKCASTAFTKIKPIYLELVIAGIIYYFDIFVLVDIEAKKEFFLNFASSYSAIIKIVSTVILLFVFIKDYSDKKKENSKRLLKSDQKKLSKKQKKVKYEEAI